MSEQEWVEEVSSLTEEQWERILAWHRKRMGREITPLQIPIQIDPALPNDTIRIGDQIFKVTTDDHSR